jgi:hypothetical protein
MNHGYVSSSPPHENNEGAPVQPRQGFGPVFLVTGRFSLKCYLGGVALGGPPARQHRLRCTPGRPSRHGIQPVRQHLEAARQQPALIRHPEHPTDKACVKFSGSGTRAEGVRCRRHRRLLERITDYRSKYKN